MGSSGEHVETDQILIAALGASAGGLEAFEKFFTHVPERTGIAFVIVQHLAPDHSSALAEILARHTRMVVEQAHDNTQVAPNRVYIIPPNATLTINKSTLRVATPTAPRGQRTPIDSLFSSLAEDHGENAVCIMLSGTGTDGTLGLRAIKEHGGMAMAQTLDSAKYDAILRSAIATGLVDHILAVEDMPAKLMEYAAHLRLVKGNGTAKTSHEQMGVNLDKIHAILRRRSGHDFSQYKGNTFMRRLERRMKALQIETVEGYVKLLDQKAEEADQLFKDLLIGVTHFFRDSDAFETLGREVIPKLFEGKDATHQIRVCVVGCASGEEAYSIAILLCEHAASLDSAPQLQIFATDIDERGLEIARKGRYPESIEEHISAERLERFFTKQDHVYQVKRELRAICIFSNHSFIKDPPFSRLDLISCRNVMIYLSLDLQQKLIPLFHYALRSNGYAFLGPSENTSSHRDLFKTVDKKYRIYQRKESLPRPIVRFPLSEITRQRQAGGNPPEGDDPTLPKQIERVILKRHGPACVVVKENGKAVYFAGRISRYLEHPTGTPDANVINMAREGIKTPLRAALHRAATTKELAFQKQVSSQINGAVSHVNITVEPLSEFQDADLYMILFEEVAPPTSTQVGDSSAFDASSEEVIRYLESELRSAQEHAQAAFEELETSNEELQSANEEYQSTNEELETAKEELQSFNEELETVNSELNRKVAEVDHANSDLQNLLNSTQIATLFLDSNLRVRSFTPAAVRMFRLIESDIGRTITDFAAQFAAEGLIEDIKEVLRTLAPRDRQLTIAQSQHFLMRVLPYRTVHNVIDGVVITFTEITQLKQAEEQLRQALEFHAAVVANMGEGLYTVDKAGLVTSLNATAQKLLGWSFEELRGQKMHDMIHHHHLDGTPFPAEECPGLRVLTQGKSLIEYDDVFIRRDGTFFDVNFSSTPLISEKSVSGLIVSFRDVSHKKRAIQAIQRRTAQFETLLNEAPIGVYVVDADFRMQQVNPKALPVFGKIPNLIGRDFEEVIHILWPPAYADEIVQRLRHTLETGEPYAVQERAEQRLDSGEREIYEWQINRIPMPDGRDGVVCYFGDISRQVLIREAIAQSAERLRFMAESMPQKIFTAKPNGDFDYFNQQWIDFAGLSVNQLTNGNLTKLLHPEDVDESLRLWKHSLDTGEPFKFTQRFRRYDGVYRWHLSRAHAMRNVAGEVSMWIGSNTDIHEQKEIEQDLRRANGDLSQFAFAASHDFQEPLRMITSYSQLLLKGYRGELEGEAEQCVEFISEGTKRMRELLADLLSFTSVTADEHDTYALINLDNTFRDVIQNLKIMIDESKTVVTSDPLPAVQGHSAHFVQLFQNLVGNAIKYRSERPPLVQISATQRNGEWLFSVSDNGIGIDQEYHKDIFGLFKRLHGKSIPGTGIGLAICQRVVERYGGRIWVESQLGQGTKFFFTLPRVREEKS